MKIALIGYGKMGKAIEEIAISRGHEIVLKISSSNKSDFTAENLNRADVAIEFTNPESALENLQTCLHAGMATVCGSTGWLNSKQEIEDLANEKKLGFLYASNFSIGVNIFFELNTFLAKMMDVQPEYDVVLEEIHHTAKKDAPSGTAITLAEQILSQISRKTEWVKENADKASELAIKSVRIDPAPGTHVITYHSDIDDIEIKHTAHNRKGFAFGAVLAAEYVATHKGVSSMKDVLGF
ncbi:MAG: 4-hydroxy-tetrahydrodipicolinate reductase [Pseudopedobacter saltans]|uniref:4-hydroxy-tetrahydrodipicolinate reductase n=1 Tax=Pseudopedobacter saltans TaxID=151895 RepID=A0A2W5FC13_9SPHI|nr:MAG: 4-hydroxy-tetrahydrodipicolinate reductase [Pseudopedobacter saltans]